MPDQPPEQKNGLLELLKNLWLPAAGFVGAVTLAYNFYQSWLGDQAAFTYISGGIGLLVLLIALAWVGFKTKTVTRKILLLNESTITEKIPAYTPIYQRAARISLVIVFLAGLVGVGVLFQRRQALQEKLVVLIATFEGPEEVYGLRNEIIEKLNADFPNDAEVEIVKIDDVITPDQGTSYARSLGERYLADVVLWGWYRPTPNPNITIHIENLNQDQLPLKTSDTLQPTVTLADLESFSFQQQSGQETSALISFLVGYIEYQSKNYPQALAYFDDALNKISGGALLIKNQAKIYSYRASTHVFLKQYDLAIIDLSKATRIDPKDEIAAVVYNNLGGNYINMGFYELAVKQFDKSIEGNSQLFYSYNNRGFAYAKMKQYQQAIIDYSKAIELNQQHVSPYVNRATVYDDLKQYEKARVDYSKAIELNPQNHSLYAKRGLTNISQGQFEQAITDFSKAIELNPQDALYYVGRGIAYRGSKQNIQTVADFSKAIEINPQESFYYFARGDGYIALKQYEKAIIDYTNAIKINPRYVQAYYNRGLAYYSQKQYSQAIGDFSKAIEIKPPNADTYHSRGLAYQALGKTAEAEADFAKYKELGGQDGNP